MKHISYPVITLLLFMVCSCHWPSINPGPQPAQPKPKPDTLPPATQEGKNTFGCLVNGKVWLPGGSVNCLEAQYYHGMFMVGSSKQVKDRIQSINWAYKPIYGPGTYYFKYTIAGSPGAGFIDYSDTTNWKSTDKDSLYTYVTVTRLDSIKRIISGTFRLRFTPPGNDTLDITNGRFDMKYFY
jgi:hypothetical protein